jgi:hypothetical protein
MTLYTIAARTYNPLSFQPPVDRLLVTTLSLAATALWLFVLPLELALS